MSSEYQEKLDVAITAWNAYCRGGSKDAAINAAREALSYEPDGLTVADSMIHTLCNGERVPDATDVIFLSDHDYFTLNYERIAEKARHAASHSRHAGPMPYPDSSRELLLGWLQWNDRNGCYSDEDSAAEGYAPLSLESCWALIAEALGEG